MTGYVGLNLLTETRVNIWQYGGHSEVLVPLMAVVYKCQTHTTSTGGNRYDQLQVVAEKCDVAIPCYVVFVGIFSSYSPRSSISFLDRFSKKESEIFPSNQVSVTSMTSTSEEKLRPFNCFFSPENRWYSYGAQILIIGWVIKTLDDQVVQCLLGCKCPVSRGIVMQEQDHLGELPATFFPQNVLQLHQQKWVRLRVNSLALWKVRNGRIPSWSQKIRGENFSSGFLHSEFFGAWWSAMTPPHRLLLCLRVIAI